MSDIILRTDAVAKSFGKFKALSGITASFPRGALTSIIGPNGAGKSTYFNLLSGAFPPTSGRVEFEGRDITGTPQHKYARLGIAKSFQITTVFPQISGLWDRRDRLAGSLAHGEQRALEIAMALASAPRLLLLDEPTAGMSPEETRSMMDLIVRLAAERTVILVEHKMKLVMGISDRLLVLHHGELLAEGTPDEIRRNETVKRVYLGQREH